MEEYLKKSDVMRVIDGQYPEPHYPSWFAGIVRDMPAADIQIMSEGEWVFSEDWHGIRRCGCSVCGQEYDGRYFTLETAEFFQHCPKCGAKLSYIDVVRNLR